MDEVKKVVPDSDEDDESDDSPLHNAIQISQTDDENTLVDVHVNNPLKKITKLLEEIKKQKAFSFTIKGSLGIAGIALVITSFGIFGGTKAFCTRGIQTETGTFKILKIADDHDAPLPFIDQVKGLLWNVEKDPGNRMVLIKQNTDILHITRLSKADARKISGKKIYVTGEYDACSQTIALSDAQAVELSP